MGCRIGLATTLWLLGYPEQALARLNEAMALAHELSLPYGLGFARAWVAWVFQFLRDVPAVYEQAEAIVTLATTQSSPLLAAMGTSFRGWALAMQGQDTEGTAQVRQGITTWRATGAVVWVPHLCALLAEVLAHRRHTVDGLKAMAEHDTLADQ